jgi:hypothetical protein
MIQTFDNSPQARFNAVKDSTNSGNHIMSINTASPQWHEIVPGSTRNPLIY